MMRNETKLNPFSSGPVLLMAMVLTLLAAGCESLAPTAQPSDFLKVTGEGEPFNFEKALEQWPWRNLPKMVEATGGVELERKIADPSQRAMIGRAGARREALRTLWGGLEASLRGGGQLKKDEPGDSLGMTADIEKVLETQSAIEYEEAEGRAVAHASAPTAELLRALHRHGALVLETGTRSQEERRKDAKMAAVDDAKNKLRVELGAMKLSDGRTLDKFLESNKDAARDLDVLIFIAKSDAVEYFDNDACRVTIYFDRNRARQLAEGDEGGFWSRLF